MRNGVLGIVTLSLALMTMHLTGYGQTTTAKEIIGIERAALDQWGHGDPQGFLQLFAPEVTYFDPYVKQRVDGFEAMKMTLGALAGTFTIPRCEMIGPVVQFHGNTAVLTFNLVNYRASGEVINRWNATEIYSRMNRQWKIIHSHWSLTAVGGKEMVLQ